MSAWHALAKVLTKVAVWAAGHPDQVVAIVQEIKTAKR